MQRKFSGKNNQTKKERISADLNSNKGGAPSVAG